MAWRSYGLPELPSSRHPYATEKMKMKAKVGAPPASPGIHIHPPGPQASRPHRARFRISVNAVAPQPPQDRSFARQTTQRGCRRRTHGYVPGSSHSTLLSSEVPPPSPPHPFSPSLTPRAKTRDAARPLQGGWSSVFVAVVSVRSPHDHIHLPTAAAQVTVDVPSSTRHGHHATPGDPQDKGRSLRTPFIEADIFESFVRLWRSRHSSRATALGCGPIVH
ncbi:hypothetical protein C8Q79DRAFT_1014266 [Trametes meyenii]|nr:hypothetical protein C8Q79DRAFT_1014266 [Trametes meyenii]